MGGELKGVYQNIEIFTLTQKVTLPRSREAWLADFFSYIVYVSLQPPMHTFNRIIPTVTTLITHK